MIKPTDEMKAAFRDAQRRRAEQLVDQGALLGAHDTDILDHGLAAVLALVERDVREQIADAIEEYGIRLRGEPFRGGTVGIEFINGVEEAAYRIRSGDLP